MQALNKHHQRLLGTWHCTGGQVGRPAWLGIHLRGAGLSWGRAQEHTNADFREMQLH